MPTQTYQWEGEYQPDISIRGEFDPSMVNESVIQFQALRPDRTSLLLGQVVGEYEFEEDWVGEHDATGSDIEGTVP